MELSVEISFDWNDDDQFVGYVDGIWLFPPRWIHSVLNILHDRSLMDPSVYSPFPATQSLSLDHHTLYPLAQSFNSNKKLEA